MERFNSTLISFHVEHSKSERFNPLVSTRKMRLGLSQKAAWSTRHGHIFITPFFQGVVNSFTGPY